MARVQLIRLLARHRPQDPAWAPVVGGWLLDAAQRKSLWMDQIVYWVLRSWPSTLTPLALTLMCIQLHPRGFAEGLRQALQRGHVKPETVPTAWLTCLAELIDRCPLGDRAVIREVLEAVGSLGNPTSGLAPTHYQETVRSQAPGQDHGAEASTVAPAWKPLLQVKEAMA